MRCEIHHSALHLCTKKAYLLCGFFESKMTISVAVCYEPEGGSAPKAATIMVSRLITAADIIQQLWEEVKPEMKGCTDDYALYWPAQKVWLALDQQVGSQLENNAVLELKAKKRLITLRYLDGSSKLMLMDITLCVKGLVKEICSQLRIEHSEELSLIVAGDYGISKHYLSRTLDSPSPGVEHKVKPKNAPASSSEGSITSALPLTPGMRRREIKSDMASTSPSLKKKELKQDVASQSPSTRRKEQVPPVSPSLKNKDHSCTLETAPLSPAVRRKEVAPLATVTISKKSTERFKKQILKKHQIRLDTPWLDPKKTLSEQEVTEKDELILMFRYYYHKHFDSNSRNLEMLYKQARAMYISGELLTSVDDMIQFSGILYQIIKGNSKQKCTLDDLYQIRHLIAPPNYKFKSIAKQVATYQTTLVDLPVLAAKCLFIKLWSSLKLFGTEFITFYNIDTKDKGLIGVSKDKIILLYLKGKKNMEWNFESLIQWKHDPEVHLVSLTFKNEDEDGSVSVVNLQLPEYSAVLADCLEGHRELQATTSNIWQEYQFDEIMESTLVGKNTASRKVGGALSGLTYEEVFWARKIDNPLVSDEELVSMNSSSWENPAFENMDQLMEERFSFLSFAEDNPDDQLSGDSDTDVANIQPGPHKNKAGRQSPLVTVQGLGSESLTPRQVHHKGLESPPKQGRKTSEHFVSNASPLTDVKKASPKPF